MRTPLCASLCVAILLPLSVSPSFSQTVPQIAAQPATDLTASQIVEQMERRSEAQKEALKQYRTVRHYQVEYRGFSKNVEAAMDVAVDYDAEKGKSFTIISESGSGALREEVLKRAVNSESDAMQESSSAALTQANYRFELEGTEPVAGKPAYILGVEPLAPNKFLYRGRIWVDAADFAVVKMETQPAKSPSFWISQTQIHYTSAKTEGFWLPQHVLSVTRVRIGGTAFLNIDYGNYAIAPEPGTRTEARLQDVGTIAAK